ncbi:MAG: hypothetical protein E7086_09130 [Bacteroidales bacterium]|nr:hypothetical protein [Bacteroidales bacterium]
MGRGEQKKEKKDGYQHTIKYLGIFGGAQGFSMLLNMLRTKITSVLLGVAGQSIIAISNRTIQMFSDCTGLSLAFSAVRRMSDAYENCDDTVVGHCVKVVRSIAFLTGLLGMLLMLAVTPFISEWIFGGSSDYYLTKLLLLSPVVMLMAISNGEIAILRGTRRLNKVAIYSLATSIISLAISVPLYLFVGLGGIFPAIFATAFLQMCVLLYFTLPHYRYKVSPFSLNLLREGVDMVKMGAGYIFASILTSSAMWLICALLSDFGNGESAGLFSAGFVMITLLPGILFAALDSEYYPRLSGVAAKTDIRNAMVNEQVEVQLLVQAPLLMAFVVAMPLLVPLFYDAEFVLAIAMAQFAMFGMFMRTMTYPISFLPLVNNDTLVFVVLESAYNILLVTLVVLGFLYDGYMGVGVGIAVAHTVDFVVVYSVARFKYGMRLSVEAVRYFMVQLPLFVAVIAVSMSYSCSWYYWLMGGVLVLVSSAVSLWMFSRMAVLPSIVGKISKVFKR